MKTGHHLIQCLVYIDLNMVRAGVVKHPCEWKYGGYHAIQRSKQRYSLINRQRLTTLLDLKDSLQLSEYHHHWVDAALKKESLQRDPKWTESIAVGDEEFVEETKVKLGVKAIGRRAVQNNDGYELKESQRSYGLVSDAKKSTLRQNNT